MLSTRVVAYMLEMLVISADSAVSGSAARRYEIGRLSSLPEPLLEGREDRAARVYHAVTPLLAVVIS